VDRLKQQVVATALGRWLLCRRERSELLSECRRRFPERTSAASQAMCAKFLMPRLLESGKVFVDVGAHLGSVLSAVAAVNPTARLIGVEAIPAKARALRRNFPSIVVHECAVGDQTGVVGFLIDTERSGFSSLSYGTDLDSDRGTRIEVPIRRLDDVVAEDRHQVGVLKIDVEGAEPAVLRGAEQLVGESRPVVIFESAPGGVARFGEPDDAAHRWFTDRDYEVTLPDRVPHTAPGLSREIFLDAHHYPRRTLDYVAIPSERRLEIREMARRALGVA